MTSGTKRMPALLIATLAAFLLLPAVSMARDAEKGDEPDPEEKAAGALEGEPGLDVKARLGALWTLTNEPHTPANEFEISTARVELTWTQWKLIEASVGVEASELFDGDGAAGILRDLYVLVQPLEWLGFRAGQFKKPFSATELTSRRKLVFVDRGIANDYLVDHLLYGGRDIGVSIEGRLVESVDLDYAFGVFNGLGRNTPEIAFAGSKDVAGRLEIDPAKWLSLGVSGSLKLIDAGDLPALTEGADYSDVDPDDYPDGYTDADLKREHAWMTGTAWMAGADLKLKVQRLRVTAEGMAGENWWFEKYPYAAGGLLAFSYKIRLSKDHPLWLEPALAGEVVALLTGSGEWRTRLWRVGPALNLHIGKHVRLMIDGEFLVAQGSEADIDGSRRAGLWPNEWPGRLADSNSLMVQLFFGI